MVSENAGVHHDPDINVINPYKADWLATWRELVGGDLFGGYAVLDHPPRGDANRYHSDELPEACQLSPWEIPGHRFYGESAL